MRAILALVPMLLATTPAVADEVTTLHNCELFGDGVFTLEFVLDNSWPDQGQGTVLINGVVENEVWFLQTNEATVVFNTDDDGEWLAMFDRHGSKAWGALKDGHGDLRAIMRGSCRHS